MSVCMFRIIFYYFTIVVSHKNWTFQYTKVMKEFTYESSANVLLYTCVSVCVSVYVEESTV